MVDYSDEEVNPASSLCWAYWPPMYARLSHLRRTLACNLHRSCFTMIRTYCENIDRTWLFPKFLPEVEELCRAVPFYVFYNFIP